MSTEAKFVDGLRVYAPRDNAPDFVIADIVIEHDEFVDWLADRGDKVRFTIKRARSGKLYAEENTWKPNASPSQDRPTQQQRERPSRGAPPVDDFGDSDIPF